MLQGQVKKGPLTPEMRHNRENICPSYPAFTNTHLKVENILARLTCWLRDRWQRPSLGGFWDWVHVVRSPAKNSGSEQEALALHFAQRTLQVAQSAQGEGIVWTTLGLGMFLTGAERIAQWDGAECSSKSR
jgi:hypothetical protein